jgi:uncharacterized protein (DUF433 family)
MNSDKLISRDPKIMLGKPIITGTRIGVEIILRKLSEGYSISDILEAYSHLSEQQIYACLAYATSIVANEEYSEA